MIREAPNIQSLWGALVVEELVRNGVTRFVVCPGSRSTPLVQAIARHPDAEVVLWNDERGAAYHALGWGRATGGPAAVITTSGTAVANLLPAAIEASLDRVPLLLLTADRPHELREVGANQSIRQSGLFGDHVRWSFDLPVPHDATPARMVLTAVDHAVFKALDPSHPGAVQLNCPFREPLAPTPEPWDPDCLAGLDDWLAGDRAFTWIERTPPVFAAEDDLFEDLADALLEVEQGLVVAGDIPDLEGVAAIARILGWPLWVDTRCPLEPAAELPTFLPHADRLLGRGLAPNVILQFGARLESKRIQAWVDEGRTSELLAVHPAPERLDPAHRVTHRFVAPIDPWCDALWEALAGRRPDSAAWPELSSELRAAHAAVALASEHAVEEGTAPSEPWVARRLTRILDTQHGLFVSNSMPIRDVQQFGVKDRPGLDVRTNRGASGIDGVVATAAGYAQGACKPVTLLIGDLALLHDVNALAQLLALEYPVTVVVLNNGGGSIFSFLPIAGHEDVLTPFVSTPHDVTFGGVCSSFGLAHHRIEDRAAFERAYADAIGSGTSSVIEVISSLGGNRDQHARIETAIAATLPPA